jgi:DNA-binding beta-propeller fold protein YncE
VTENFRVNKPVFTMKYPLFIVLSHFMIQTLGKSIYVTTILAGFGENSSKDGPRNFASFSSPSGILFNHMNKELYVTDEFGHKIRKIDSKGHVSTLAGSGVDGYINGYGNFSMFSRPTDIVMDQQGFLYVSDWNNHCIRKISSISGVVSTLAGVCTYAGYKDGESTLALFYNPAGLYFDSKTTMLFVADSSNHAIRIIDIIAANVSTLGFFGSMGTTNGLLDTATLRTPIDISRDSKGAFYFIESGRHLIRKISGGLVTVFAGQNSSGYADGPSHIAKFNNPNSILIDHLDNLYVSDKNHIIRHVNSSGFVSTFAGTTLNAVNNGLAYKSEFKNPRYMDVDDFGTIYVSDSEANNIRAIYDLEMVEQNMFFSNDSWYCTIGFCSETLIAVNAIDNHQV